MQQSRKSAKREIRLINAWDSLFREPGLHTLSGLLLLTGYMEKKNTRKVLLSFLSVLLERLKSSKHIEVMFVHICMCIFLCLYL